MAPRLITTVLMAPLLILWQVVLPVTELRALSAILLIVAGAAIVRLVASEIRLKVPRVLILGSGQMTSRLIEEIEAPGSPRYAIAGIVDNERPDADSPDAARWLGPCAGRCIARLLSRGPATDHQKVVMVGRHRGSGPPGEHHRRR